MIQILLRLILLFAHCSTLAEFKKLVIYTSSSCNLYCKYCYLHDYEGEKINYPFNYRIYINKFLELNNNNAESLESIELWGGEPLLGIQGFIDYLPRFLNTFPQLRNFYISSNFAMDNSAQAIIRLMSVLHGFGNNNNEYNVYLQISIDGQPEINDYNRGEGTTQAVINNYNQLADLVNEYTHQLYNVNLFITTKSTLSPDNFCSRGEDDLYPDTNFLPNLFTNWMEFFVDNFYRTDVNIRCNLFDCQKNPPQGGWRYRYALDYALALDIVDKWKTQHPEYNSFFIYTRYSTGKLDLCEAGQLDTMLALLPSGKRSFCHRAIGENAVLNLNEALSLNSINLSNVYQVLMNRYYSDEFIQESITEEDFKKSIPIYLMRNWCPYEHYKSPYLDNPWFFEEIELLYYGAMNILLKWSEENG